MYNDTNSVRYGNACDSIDHQILCSVKFAIPNIVYNLNLKFHRDGGIYTETCLVPNCSSMFV